MLLDVEKLGQFDPLLIDEGQKVEVVLEFLFDRGETDLLLSTLLPHFLAPSYVVPYHLEYVPVCLLG